MPRIELQSDAVMFHGFVELAKVTIAVAKEVVDIRIVRRFTGRLREMPECDGKILGLNSFSAG